MAISVGTHGYLYSTWQGRFDVKEGYCLPANYNQWTGRFSVKYGHKVKYFQCALEPGVVYNSAVWLTTRDDELAKRLFIEKEESTIRELQEKIRYHEWVIKMLTNE